MRVLSFLFLLLSGAECLGQSPLPDYGTIITDEIRLKECSFDKDADAIILFDNAVSTYNEEKHLITKRRIKIKILKEKGVNYGNVQIGFVSIDEFETIEDLEAYVCNFDENGGVLKTIVDKKSIFINKVSNQISVIKIAMPGVKVGSIIEYRYTSNSKSFYSALRDWYFQTGMPTVVSQYDLTLLPGSAFAYKIVKSKYLPIDVKTLKDEGRVIFEMKNIGGLRDEPFMDAPEDYRQRIVFQLAEYRSYYGTKEKVATSWSELAKFLLLDDEFGKLQGKKIKQADQILDSIKLLPDTYLKMKSIYTFVRKGFSWNGSDSKYAREGLKKVWDKRSGTSGELNWVLINLLNGAGLEVFPLLVSERAQERVDGSYPFLDQFRKVVALVVHNGNRYILDATDEFTPMHIIPFSLLNTNAFIVSKNSNTVLFLKDDNRMMKNYIGIMAEINQEGVINGNVRISSYEYSRLDRLVTYRKKSKEQFITKYFQEEVSNMVIDSFEVGNVDNDSLPFAQSFHFTATMPLSGEYRIVSLNLFGTAKTPFISDNRFTNINFGSQLLHNTTQILRIPASMVPEALPKNSSLVMPDNSMTISRLIEFDESKNTLTLRIKWQITKTVFTPEEYPIVKEFFKKMVDLLNEPFVLKRKK